MRESHGELEARIGLLTRELNEAFERETATDELLRVIASSPTDIKPVLDAVAASAARLCDTYDVIIRLKKDDMLHLGAHSGPVAVDEAPWPLNRERVMARSVIDVGTVQVEDLTEAGAEFAAGREMAIRYGFRTILATPLVSDGRAIGAISLRRREVRPFSERQIKLLKTFADQAVIAISNVRLFEEVQARTAELSEALAQQTATADVLKVISRSAFDLEPVLQTLLDSAIRLAGGDMGSISLRDGDWLRVMTGIGWTDELRAYEKSHPHPIGRGTFQGRAALEEATIHVPDVSKDMEYKRPEAASMGHFRAALSVPLKRGQEVIGVFGMARRTVGPFSQRQIELVETFADQAVIAIENVRLFEEVQQRTREATEALEYQTATSDVLGAISRSPTDVQPVFNMIAQSAARLCEAQFCFVYRYDGQLLHFVAHHGITEESVEIVRNTFPVAPSRGSAAERAILYLDVAQIPDLTLDSEFTHRAAAAFSGLRSAVAVPMLRDGLPIGCIAVGRAETGLLADKQVELLKTFADQAVIAIENVRLFDEVQVRTAELSESLQQQTATADVLKVISRSAFDLKAVLDALAATVTQLCEADGAAIMRQTEGKFRDVASYGYSPDFSAYLKGLVHVPGRGTVVGRVLLEGKTVQIADTTADTEYTLLEGQRLGGFRTVLGVPLLREGRPVGVLSLTRSIVKPFNEKQIELVETFADQAVIAIENVRLFEEVKARTAELDDALTQQTATADVLKVISRSTFDLNAVLQALIKSAAQLCNAQTSGIYMLNGGVYRLGAAHGQSPEFRAFEETHPVPAGRGSWVGRAALERSVIHVPDVSKDTEHAFPEVARLGGFASVLCVPLMREGEPVGIFALTRPEAGPFTERQIDLIKTFADQAVIAIENVRLFEEVNKRTDELARSLNDLRTAQDRLIQTEKLASLGQLTAGIAHEIKNPLNFVNNFSSLTTELIGELQDVLERASLDGPVRAEVVELTGLMKDNLDKVVQHGRRADSIVKNMLLHSRAGSGEHRPISINAVVEESLNLAYHGARAEGKDFEITLQKSLDPEAGEVDLYPQEITRVLLNLISNSFYATRRRGAEANGEYEPVLKASTANLGDRVEIRIRDNGTGIPADVREKMFNPFFTTKPAGEGTGLGLSLSHDIVVKQHAGTITVDTKPGEFTEFRIVLPRAASLAKTGELP